MLKKSRRELARERHETPRRAGSLPQWTARQYREVEAILGYRFRNRNLLSTALSHRSATHSERWSYEALEFLGDRVMSFALSRFVCRTVAHVCPRDLAKLEQNVLCNNSLSAICIESGLSRYIAADVRDPRTSPNKVSADVIEALCGAVNTDATDTDSTGTETTNVVLRLVFERLHFEAGQLRHSVAVRLVAALEDWESQQDKQPLFHLVQDRLVQDRLVQDRQSA